MIEVRVPATSANIGPGFDCMGIAWNLYAKVSFTLLDKGIHITGCDEAWCNADNLIYQAFVKTLERMGETIPGIGIHIESDVPQTRGLGSSATCIVAGAVAANALFKNRLNKYEIFDICTEMEGHPDNIAPALFGSLTVAFMEEEKPSMIRYLVDQKLSFLAIIPDYTTSTEEARRLLPKELSYQDAIYNIGRCAALAKGLEIGNPIIIKKACKDKLHEPYRKVLIPEYDEVQKRCQEAGALACFISGSGPTLLAVGEQGKAMVDLQSTLQQLYPSWSMIPVEVDRKGVFVKEL